MGDDIERRVNEFLLDTADIRLSHHSLHNLSREEQIEQAPQLVNRVSELFQQYRDDLKGTLEVEFLNDFWRQYQLSIQDSPALRPSELRPRSHSNPQVPKLISNKEISVISTAAEVLLDISDLNSRYMQLERSNETAVNAFLDDARKVFVAYNKNLHGMAEEQYLQKLWIRFLEDLAPYPSKELLDTRVVDLKLPETTVAGLIKKNILYVGELIANNETDFSSWRKAKTVNERLADYNLTLGMDIDYCRPTINDPNILNKPIEVLNLSNAIEKGVRDIDYTTADHTWCPRTGNFWFTLMKKPKKTNQKIRYVGELAQTLAYEFRGRGETPHYGIGKMGKTSILYAFSQHKIDLTDPKFVGSLLNWQSPQLKSNVVSLDSYRPSK